MRARVARGSFVVLLAASVTWVGAGQFARGASSSCDWPMYQHDTSRTGAAAAGCDAIGPQNAATLAPRWFAPTKGGVTASPIVVGDTVFVGDNAGIFYAITATTGTVAWQFNIRDNTIHDDQHKTPYLGILSSAAHENGTVYFGGGGTVWALDAASGSPVWAVDTDPSAPTSRMEVESSPVVHNGVVYVGTDVNESSTQHATGLLAINAATGDLLWKFNPEDRSVSTTLSPTVTGHACGDIWSSPAVDDADGLVVFGLGNCNTASYVATAGEGIEAVRADTGAFAWHFGDGRDDFDDDFGATPIVSPLPVTDVTGVVHPSVVLAAGKSGHVFVLDGPTGTNLRDTQLGQPGQTGPRAAGAIGGFIGSDAVGVTSPITATMFAGSAVPLPFEGKGPTAGEVQPDGTLTNDPARLSSLHAIDIATGRILWHQPLETPTYAAVTYANGVVFAPSTTSFAEAAYDAATGTPLWHAPDGAAPSSAVAVVGPNIFYGAGTTFSGQPPQAFGVWSYGLPSILP
ncbi:MAG: hypothetical protein E6G17_01285 [Actinobacteria bacterium]|nr:MAG: hypothetical protein E6G17_01285 [Actinomycetota bacterium]